MTNVRASVVVTSHNYESFLGEAIDSALAQTLSGAEVIVVDDGSTDRSRAIIADYGDRVTAVLREQGGGTAAMCTGFAISQGAIVCWLDADDVLEPTALERAWSAFEPGTAVVHWPMREIGADGRETGLLRPRSELAEGDLRDVVLREGPDSVAHPPTSGSVWARWFLDQTLPEMPGDLTPLRWASESADAYLAALAPLYGRIGRLAEPLSSYRLHGANDYAGSPFDQRLPRDVAGYRVRCRALARHCERLGLPAAVQSWEAASWLLRLERTAAKIIEAVPAGATIALMDDGEWHMNRLPGRPVVPVMERDGAYWGLPADGMAAVRELARLRATAGASYAVVGWPSSWWLEHYPTLAEYLRERPCLFADEDVAVYALDGFT